MKETAELIEGSVAKARNGSEIAERTAGSLAKIVDGATRMKDLVGEIASASNEQAQGISQINQGLGQIEQVTQQNTASSEEGAAAAEELSGQAEHLRAIMARFRIKDGAAAEGDARRAMPAKTARLAAPRPKGAARPAQETLPGGQQTPEQLIALDDHEFGKY